MPRAQAKFASNTRLGGNATRRIAILAIAPVDALDVVGPAEAFALANRLLPGRTTPYQVDLISAGPDRLVATEAAISLHAQSTLAEEMAHNRPIDTLLVACGIDNRNDRHSAAVEWIRKKAGEVRRVCGVCVGAFILAQAGLLDGKLATTHWAMADEMATGFPRIKVDPRPIWIREGHVYTSAGISAGIDLALALIAEDLGRQAAMTVAKALVVFLQRPGGQAQFSTALKMQAPTHRSLDQLQVWIAEHLDRDLGIDVLADRLAVSRRTLIRTFKQALQVTPAKYVEAVRLEAAKQDLEMRSGDLAVIARRCGFQSVDVMRRAFLRNFGTTPTQYAERFNQD